MRDKIISAIEKHKQADASLDGVSDDDNLIELGIIDSLGFVNLVLVLKTDLNSDVGLGDIDPFEHTSIAGLISFFS